ncbi:MAG: 23S rRNA (adenine(2503)-C(2))-methyltransferase RlmN [Bacteroidales bacterium]|nr:23S rRNA (adenine(2503)-C(2))-methyltransferase RlmN [Bacteroidales bacterium]MCI2121524.1 23S rRNA (adenine(2503)-C(2))-methyltransferase RlmN [Bacteroidales bacterium]MCI2145534.1 23S rRNA (adenine(2503)-C(2))-methyltransferase RlmN [Bacteroidales bacterium]
MKTTLLGCNLSELGRIADTLNLPSFTASQIAEWLYAKGSVDFDSMTNISKRARAALEENCRIGRVLPSEVRVSEDGTKKYLFPAGNEGRYIETVMIPQNDRFTLCVSSQIGCKMGCKFCMTGRQGFHGNLTAADIMNQFLSVDEFPKLTNAVFMGMGEPLDNYDNVKKAIEILTSDWGFGWSPKRITVSTVGILPALKKYLEESRCHLAVSLHTPDSVQRAGMMPVEKAYGIADVVGLVKRYDFTGQRRVSFEYIMFEGVNDDKKHADAVVRLLRGLECRVNLIRFHTIPDSPLKPSSDASMNLFMERLNRQGITTTIRASRGQDIFAACGLLSGSRNEKDKK